MATSNQQDTSSITPFGEDNQGEVSSATAATRKPIFKKRRKTKKARETQERILQAALKLFRENGFEKTSMRDIADAASVAVGASYYYYSTKEELVLAYYEDTCSKDTEFVEALVVETKSFKERFRKFLQFKVDLLSENRCFINVLARSAANPSDPLSPFNDNTKHIRDHAINLMGMMAEGSDMKVSSKIRPLLPEILWFYMMGVIFFWIHDKSTNQKQTRSLITVSTELVLQLFWLSSLPLTGAINSLVVSLVEAVKESQTPTDTSEAHAAEESIVA